MLNFAKVPFRNERLPRLLYGVTAAALLVLTLIHGVALTRYLLREQEALDVKVEDLKTELDDLRARREQTENALRSQTNGVRTERIQFLAGLFQQKSFPWTALFNQLEALTPPGVRITSISPGEPGKSPGEIQVNLEVIGRSLDDILEMVKTLEADQLFTTVLPLRESVNEREGGGVAAALTLQYLRSRARQVSEPSEALPDVEGMEDDGPISPLSSETGEDDSSTPEEPSNPELRRRPPGLGSEIR